jgi:hypothetical protein
MLGSLAPIPPYLAAASLVYLVALAVFRYVWRSYVEHGKLIRRAAWLQFATFVLHALLA